MRAESWVIWGPIAATLALSFGLILQPWLDPVLIFRDPPFLCEQIAPAADYKRYFGFGSMFGVFGWVASAAICLFGALLLARQQASRRVVAFYAVAGLLTGVLALDDHFLIHEYANYKVLHGHEELFYALYLGPAAAYGLLGLSRIFGRGAAVFAVAAACLISSVLLDLLLHTNSQLLGGLEEVTKLTGIVALLVFHVRCLLDDVAPSQTNGEGQ